MLIKKNFQLKKMRYMTFFMVILTINWFFITSAVPLVEAANSLVDIELFTNQQTSNTSGSTYENPLVFSSENPSYDVDFVVTGEALAEVELLNTTKQVVLTIPDDLVGKVEPRAEAEVEVVVLLSGKSNIAGPLITALQKLITGIINTLALLLPKSIKDLLDELNILIIGLTELGRITYEIPIEQKASEAGSFLVADYQNGLVLAIVGNLSGTLLQINTVLDKLTGIAGSGLVGSLLKGVLDLLLSPVTIALEALAELLNNPLENTELIDSLANASILSNTKVTFPTTIHDPGEELYGDANGVVAETFIMRIVQTGAIDLNIIKQAHNPTTVYLQGKKTESQLSLDFPENLNFGQHTIQTTRVENWVATETGNQAAPLTTGNLHLIDTSNTSKSWQIKVRQQTNWVNNTNELTNAILNMHGGDLEIDGFSDEYVRDGFASGPISLMAGEEKEVLSLNQTDQRGSIKLGIDKFELRVPKNIEKKQGEYGATFIWTASDTP